MARTLLRIVAAPDAERQAWADSISVPPQKYRLDPAWAQAFERLGRLKEAQAMQEEVAREVYWARAVKDLKAYGRMTETDAALFFDTAVQNGGINAAKRTRIETALAKNPSASGRARLRLLADAIADGSGARYREDVRTRRRAIADGEGLVHGAKYRLAHWALDLSPVAEADLA